MPDSVPYIVHESALARSERTIRRLIAVLVISIMATLVSNMAWLWYWNQYEYADGEVSTEISQDGRGINIVGDSNGVTNESAD